MIHTFAVPPSETLPGLYLRAEFDESGRFVRVRCDENGCLEPARAFTVSWGTGAHLIAFCSEHFRPLIRAAYCEPYEPYEPAAEIGRIITTTFAEHTLRGAA